jgi:6-pyruvoyltetrahydropterin/6-carboxytetrahydropterin synthase
MAGNAASLRSVALLRQQFEFAASHRLHIASLSEAQNRELFGKCNNPRGHGHNYRVEPCVEVEVPTRGPAKFGLRELESLTAELIINRYDHKHLNEDTVEFGPSGLNPSVENIAKVCFDHLAPAVSRAGARLRSITVWETDKTGCTYPADAAPL